MHTNKKLLHSQFVSINRYNNTNNEKWNFFPSIERVLGIIIQNWKQSFILDDRKNGEIEDGSD